MTGQNRSQSPYSKDCHGFPFRPRFRIGEFRELLTEAFTKDRVDFEKLSGALLDVVGDRPERYTFTWTGERDALRITSFGGMPVGIDQRDRGDLLQIRTDGRGVPATTRVGSCEWRYWRAARRTLAASMASIRPG
jgi:hypothetical protein